ncbi:MAG: hypothetical protein KGQ59_02975 [Bdellovibrionales bacterium]|nr:hypothetical protein [Bdellovibrionales bacterium]
MTRIKSPWIPFALSVLMVATSVGATEYTLREGCALRKFEGGKWQETDPSVLEGTSVGKLNRHGNRVRFKVEGVWHSAEAKCLVAAADPQSEEELRPSKRYRDSSLDKKNRGG